MVCHLPRSLVRLVLAGFASASLMGPAVGQAPSAEEIRALVEQNRRLQERLEGQQRQIDSLLARLTELEGAASSRRAGATQRGSEGQVRLSAEVSVAYFDSGPEGNFPNAEFRVDDAKVHLEAPVWRDTYVWAELELTTREVNDEFFHVGELYLDVERLAEFEHGALNLRVGRFFLPFGEEYQFRSALTNPLISHSASDIWGIDEGIQAYGSIGRVSYNLAITNGGHKTLRDFNSDKALIGRIGFDASPRLRLSASAMRTGDLDSINDPLSEVWFGNAFFRPLGGATTTRTYSAQLQELDAVWRHSNGHVRAMAGWATFEEERTSGHDERDLRYYSIELDQRVAGDLHGALRYSGIEAPDGYPIAGQADDGRYFYNPFALFAREVERITAGLRYKFSDPLVWKIEYSRERTKNLNGTRRGDADMLSSQVGVKF